MLSLAQKEPAKDVPFQQYCAPEISKLQVPDPQDPLQVPPKAEQGVAHVPLLRQTWPEPQQTPWQQVPEQQSRSTLHVAPSWELQQVPC